MSRDWITLQTEFRKEHKQSGINLKKWCEENEINYSTARRNISLNKTKARIGLKNTAISDLVTLDGKVRHGGFSDYFSTDIAKKIKGADLFDELDFSRARTHNVANIMQEIERLIEEKPGPDIAASLLESYLKADVAADRNIQRTESISKTLSSLRLDVLAEKAHAEKSTLIEINIIKSKRQIELLDLQIIKAQKEIGGTSKLDEYLDQKIGQDLDKII